MKTCPHCGERPGTEPDELDGRPVVACKPCLAEVPDPPAGTSPHSEAPRIDPARIEADVLEVVRDLGAPGIRVIADALGIGPSHTDATRFRALTGAIERLVVGGEIAVERVRPGKTRRAVIYRIARAA